MGFRPYNPFGGSGAGFTLGPIDNLFGTTSGSATAQPLLVIPAATRAAAEDVRDAYFTDNPGNLATYDAEGNETLGILLYFLDGSNNVTQTQTRVGGAWRDSASIVAIQGLPGSGTDFSAISDYHLPMIGPGPNKLPIDSGIARAGLAGMFEAEAGMIFPRNSIQIGHAGVLSGFGALIKGQSFVTGRTFVHPFQYYDPATGTSRTVDLTFPAAAPLPVQPVFDTVRPLSATVELPLTSAENEVIYSVTFKTTANTVVTGTRLRLTVQGQTDPFYYYPTRAGFENNQGVDLTADANGDVLIDLSDAPIFLLENPTVDIDYAVDSGPILGNDVMPFILFSAAAVTLNDLARMDDVGGSTSATTTTTATDLPTIAPAATNQQLANQAIDGAIATLQNTIFNSGRSFIRFNDGFTIDNTNLATFEDKNIIYTAKNDKPIDGATRPDVFLPTDADIAAAGESYPVTFEFTHLGGTTRSTTTNLVRFFFEGEIIGQILRDDAAVIVKTGAGVDYEISTGTFNPGDTILPTGVFNLKVDTPISNIATIATELSGVSIVAGDAFLVETGGSWSGLTIPDNSILVAVVNAPSLLDSATNNDWLLLDNPRVNAKSAALLANFVQDGILFSSTRNVQVDPANVFEFSAEATGTPEAREIGTNSQGSGRSIIYTNVPIQFTDLVGGRLMINLNFNVTSVSGFAPAFTSVRLEYPGGIVFDFPVTGTPTNGNFMAGIDIPNVDYSPAINQDCTLTLFFDFFGASFFGDYTVLNVVNTSKGRLHDAISSLIVSESIPLETRLQNQINMITGELGSDEASFEAIQDRISPYRNNVSLSPDINVRYLDSTGSDNFPLVSAMTAVNPLNTEYTMGTTAVFIAVATGVEQAVMNGGTQTLLTSANAQTDPNLELGESEAFEGRTYFVYRLSNQTVNDVIQTFDLTFVRVVAWQDDINTLDADIDRIDAELEHAALNLSDDVIQVLDNNVTVTEESNPTIVATDYNKSFSTNDTQTVFYEANPKTPSLGKHDSDAISASSSKLVVIPDSHQYSNGVILQANDGTATTDLVSFVNGELVANVFVPAIPPGSKTVTVYPTPATQVQRDWYSIPLHAPDLHAEADELFFTRNVPIAATTLNFQYRYDANGGHGATKTINLVITNIAVDASVSASLSLPDGESVNVGFDWQAAQRRIRVTGNPFASDPNFFIFDMEVGVTFTETRTTPAVPATTRPVVIGLQRATGQDAVIATKVSTGGDLILVGDDAEVDTNYQMVDLFGVGLVGNLIVFSELATYLNYTQFTPSAQSVVSLENHATLPQFGLFTTEYTHETLLNVGTQLTVLDLDGNVQNALSLVQVVGGKTVRAVIIDDGSGGYELQFNEL